MPRQIADWPRHFWSKVVAEGDCWIWTGTRYGNGYGVAYVRRAHKMAHRVAYELMVGEIPEGLVLDHLCDTKLCVNPYHLNPSTHRVNILRGNALSARRARQTECIRGHEFTPANTYIQPSGSRACRACRKHRDNARRAAAERGTDAVA